MTEGNNKIKTRKNEINEGRHEQVQKDMHKDINE